MEHKMQYKSFMEKLKGKQHKIDKNKNGVIDAQDFKILQKEDLSEAQVSTKKYSWGTMKTIHHGSDFSIPLHPEHHKEIAKLKDEQEHKFKTEDGKHWTARRKGDDVHFQGANNGGTTKVPHATMQEAYHSDTYGAVGSDPHAVSKSKGYGRPSAGMIERIKKLKAKEEKDRANGTGNYKKQTQSQRDAYVKNQMSALKHIGEDALEEVELEEGTFKYHMDKAVAAHMKADSKKSLYHLGNAKTARYAMKTADYSKNKDLFDKYKQMSEENLDNVKEEAELSENAPFKKLEHAVAYATDKVKTHRDNLDGIEVYKHKAGGYDVNHTMNSSGRNSLNKTGAKHLGTVYKDKPTNIKEDLKEYSMDDVRKDAADRLKKDMDTASDKRIADLKTPKKKEGFFHMVGRKQIAAAKGAIKGFKEQTDLTEQDRESDDYSRRHTVVAHVSDNTGTPADGEKRAVVKKALSVLAATPKHAEKAAHKHFSDKGYKVHKLSAVIAKQAPSMKKEEVEIEEAREFASYLEAESAAKPGQKPKLNPATNKYNLVSEGAIPKGGLDVSKVAHAGDTPHEEDWTKVQKKKNIPFDGPYKSTFKKKNNPNRTGSDAARALAQRGMPKEETEGNPMKSYAEFVQDLQEIKLADLPSRKITGTSYGAQYHDPEGDDDADDKKPAKAADAPKRGRGRPAGAMSGARQQGSAKQRKTGGVDYTGYKLHLPNNNK
jgi:hypothetical protein